MIKIGFIIDTIESPTAGTEKQLLMLIKYLDRTRFAPTLFVLRSSDWLENEFDLCPLEVIGFRSFFSLGSYISFLGFVKTLKQQKFDCFQTHFIDSNIIGIIGAKLADIPSIISSRRDQGYWHTPFKLIIFKLLNTWVKYFVANCYATALWASNTESISLDNIKIIYNGIEIDKFCDFLDSDKNYMRQELGLPLNSFVVVIVANLRPVKQIDTFLRAAKLISIRRLDACFLVVGDGEQRDELEDLAKNLGISDKIIFLGKRIDVPRILNACDIAVLSSGSESFSNAIVEYFAAGLPVVATDVGGCREIIDDGINGYIVPPSDFKIMAERIYDLSVNNELDDIRKINRTKAEMMFSSNSMVNEFEKLYAEGSP